MTQTTRLLGTSADEDDHQRRTWRHGAAVALLAVGVLPVAVATAEPSSIALQRERVRTLEIQVSDLNTRAAAAEAAYNSAQSRLGSLNQQVRARTAELHTVQADEKTARARMSARLIALYRANQPTLAETIITSGSITTGLNSWSALRRVAGQDQTIIGQLGVTRVRVADTKARLTAARVGQRAAVKRRRETKSVLFGARAQRAALLNGARGQLAVFIQAEQRRQASIAAAQAAAAAAAARRAAPVVRSTTPAPASGGSATPATPPAAAVTAPAATTSTAGILNKIAACESGGSATAVSPSGQYRGKYQFDPPTWKRNGGAGSDPAAASVAEQDRVAAVLYTKAGATPWPVCGRFAR